MPTKTTPLINKFIALIVLLILLFSMSACGQAKPTSNPPGGTAPAYPPPSSAQSSNNTTPVSGSAYPAPRQESPSSIPVVPFRLNKPLLEGATEVSGSGPVGVPIIIADVTLLGEELGKTQIDSSGKFSITLQNPLEINHKIGIGLDKLEGTKYAGELFSDPGFFGQDPQQVPMVGFFYDSAMVQPK